MSDLPKQISPPDDLNMQLRSGTSTLDPRADGALAVGTPAFYGRSKRKHAGTADTKLLHPKSRVATDERTQVIPLTEENIRSHNYSYRKKAQMAPTRKNRASPSTSGVTSELSSITTTDPQFPKQLLWNGVMHPRHLTKQPDDVDALKMSINKRRGSESYDHEQWMEYLKSVEHSAGEMTMVTKVWPKVAKTRCGNLYEHDSGEQWTEVVRSPITKGLSVPKPDYTESYRMEAYPRDAAEQLGASLSPTSRTQTMPVFAAEFKRLTGSIVEAEQQCAYDGSIMVEAAAAMGAYVHQKNDADMDVHNAIYGRTQALSIAFSGQGFTLFAHHAVKNAGRTEYHNYPIFAHLPRNSLEEFQMMLRHARNAQDWGFERATSMLKDIKRRCDGQVALMSPPDTTSTR